MTQLTAKLISESEEQARLALAPFLELENWQGAAKYCLSDGMVISNDPQQRMSNFFLTIWFIENYAQHKVGGLTAVDQLVEAAEAILKACEIRPVSSRFSELYSRLYRALSYCRLQSGDAWSALWQAHISQSMGSAATTSGSADDRLFVADRALCTGNMLIAAPIYVQLEVENNAIGIRAAARMGRILCHKLSGELQQAWALAKSAEEEYPNGHDLIIEFQWQSLLLEALVAKSLAPLAVIQDRSSPLFQTRFALVASLLGHAMRNAGGSGKVPRSSTIKSKYDDIVRFSEEHRLLKLLVTIEELTGEGEAIHRRLAKLGEKLAEVRSQESPEDALIFMAACIRWLHAEKQPTFLACVIHEYCGLSLRLSEGRRRDALGLVNEFVDEFQDIERPNIDATASPSSINSSRMLLRMSALAARASIQRLSHRVKRAFRTQPPSRAEREKFVGDLLRSVAADLGSIKGPAMKFAQLATGIYNVSPETRIKVVESLASTRGFSPDNFLRIFKAEQGKSVDQCFRTFDRNPIGVGSMGQVFRAELHDGREVAVKIHFPGMEKAVRNLESWIRLLLLPMRQLLPRIEVDHVAELVFNCFIDECDMTKEAFKHQIIYDSYRNNSDIIIPKLYPEYTSRSVLVMEYVRGLRIFEFLPVASQEEKFRFFKIIEEQHTDAAARLGWLQVDPHGGNYLFRNGQVVCLDFGSMLKIRPESQTALAEYSQALDAGQFDKLYDISIKQRRYDPAYITRSFHDQNLRGLFMGLRYPNFDQEKHHPKRFFDLLWDSRIKQGITTPPDLAVWFLSTFFLVAIRETLGLSTGPDHAHDDQPLKESA